MLLASMMDRFLGAFGLSTLSKQFLFSSVLMLLLASAASAALYLSMSVSPETINVAGAQRMLSQKIAKEALLQVQGVIEPARLQASITQFDQAHRDLLQGNPSRNISVIDTPEVRAQMQRVDGLWQSFKADLTAQTLDDSAGLAKLERDSVELLRQMNEAVGMMARHAEAQQRQTLLLAFACVLAILLLVVLGQYGGLRPLMSHLRMLEQGLTRVGEGDFTQPLHTSYRDNEIGTIFAGYNRMREHVGRLLREVQEIAGRTAAHAGAVLGTAQAAQQSGQRQYEDLEQIATAMNQMSATVNEVAQHAVQAAQSAKLADREADGGRLAVERSVDSIGRLAEQLGRSATGVSLLQREAAGVGGVLDVISGIAAQTNLLALNAAIEAARAGEAGRGFAVVADEVRTLASRTQQSTGEIQAIIVRLQDGARAAVDEMEQSAELARNNQQLIVAVTSALQAIVDGIDSITAMNTQIATAAEQQSQVAQEIDQRVTHVSGMAERTRNEGRSVVQACVQIDAETSRLSQALERFRT